MIKKVFFLIILSFICFGQERKQIDPSVELPEFVITGIEKISLPVLPKPKAELVSVLSDDYIKPTYSPEELKISEISNPIRKDEVLRDSIKIIKGRFQFGIGNNQLPTSEISFGSTFPNGLFYGKAWGRNELQYVDNAGIKNFGIEGLVSFFINSNSDFMPGAKLTFGGKYELESFNLYNPDTLFLKRNFQIGNFQFGISNLMNENLKFDIKLIDKIFYVKDRNLKENVLSLGGFFETGLKEFSIASVVMYKNQNIKYDSLSSNNNYFYINPFALLNISDVVKIKAGITYANSGNKNFFSIYGYCALRFNEKLSFYGELNPKVSFISINDLIHINRYYNPGNQQNIFLKEKMNVKAAFKYEYEKYFEFDAGLSFTDYENYIYFTDDVLNGKFDLKMNTVKKLSSYFYFLFHIGPYGLFYGDLVLESIKNYVNRFIPYSPSFKSTLAYGYQFQSGLKIDAKLYIASLSYADEMNNVKVKEYIDLGIRAEYEFYKNIRGYSEISNLINHKNYYWKGYQQKPFDIIFGVDYRWQ